MNHRIYRPLDVRVKEAARMRSTVVTLAALLVGSTSALAAEEWKDTTADQIVGDMGKAKASAQKVVAKHKAALSKAEKARSKSAKASKKLAAKADRLESSAKKATEALPKAEAAVPKAAAKVKKAKAKLRRVKKKKGDVGAAKAAVSSAKGNLRARKGKVKRLKKRISKGAPNVIKKLRAQSAKADAAAKKAQGVADKERKALDVAKGELKSINQLLGAAKHAQKGSWDKVAKALAKGAPVKVTAGPRDWLFCRISTQGTPRPATVKVCERAGGQYGTAYRHLAVAAAKAGDPGAAVAAFKNAKLASNDAEAHLAAGQAMVATKQYKPAVKYLQTGLKVRPNDAGGHHTLGQAWLGMGKKKQAVSALTAAYKLEPARKGLRYRLAKLHDELGDKAKSASILAEYLGGQGGGSSWDRSYSACARDLYHVEPYGFTVQLSQAESKALARVYVGTRAAARGATDEAAKHFQQALALAPNDMQVLYNAAVFNLGAGRYGQAKGQFEAVLKAKPTDQQSAVNLAIAEMRLGEREAAINRLQGLAARNERAKVALGVAMARGQDAAAKAQWSGIAAKSKLHSVAQHNLAAWSLGERALDQAAKFAGKKGGLEFPERHLLRGLLALEKGQLPQAKAAMQSALGMNGAYLRARLAFGKVLLASGKTDQAVKELKGAVALDPACPDSHVALGAALGKAGDAKGEAAEYRKAEALRDAARRRAQRLAGKDPSKGDDAKAKDAKRIAVVRFANTTKNPKDDWLKLGIPEALSTDLQRLSRLIVLERGQVGKLMAEVKLGELDLLDPKTAPKLGKLLGADALVVGSFQRQGETIRIDGRLVDVKSRQVLQQGSVDGPTGDLFALQRKLALLLVGKYAKVSAAEERKVKSANTASVSALEKLALMREKMLSGDKEAAQKAYREAMAQSPDFVGRIKELQKAYEDAQTRLAVAPFQNSTGKKEDAWLAEGISTALTNDMKQIGLPVVERTMLAKVMKERKLTEVLAPEKAQDLGKLAGAGVVLIGSYQVISDVVSINARMVQVDSGAVVLSERVTGPMKDVLKLQTKLAGSIAKTLEHQVSPDELAALLKDKPDIEEFKNSVLKDRLFVIKDSALNKGDDKEDEDTASGPNRAGPIAAMVTGLAVGVAGGLLFGFGEEALGDSALALRDYETAGNQADRDEYYRYAGELNDQGNGLKIGAYVAFGVAASLIIYSAVALATEEPEGDGAVDVVVPSVPKLAPVIGRDGAGLQLNMGF